MKRYLSQESIQALYARWSPASIASRPIETDEEREQSAEREVAESEGRVGILLAPQGVLHPRTREVEPSGAPITTLPFGERFQECAGGHDREAVGEHPQVPIAVSMRPEAPRAFWGGAPRMRDRAPVPMPTLTPPSPLPSRFVRPIRVSEPVSPALYPGDGAAFERATQARGSGGSRVSAA